MKLSTTTHSCSRRTNSAVVTRVRGRATRSRACPLFLLLPVCCLINCLSSIAAETFVVRVVRFLDEVTSTTCNESILMADEDGNGELNSSDFTQLIAILTDGVIDVDDIADLPLRLRTVYYLTACMCVFEPGASSICCVGDASSIPIEEGGSEASSMANRVFCSELARGIDDVKDDFTSPTSIPVNPSSAPTEQLMASLSPSTVSPPQVPTVSSSPCKFGIKKLKCLPSCGSGSDSDTYPSFCVSNPSLAPIETLCIDFQYEIVNSKSLSADDIMNEVDNSLKNGLIEATRTTVINILNATYPRTNGGGSQPSTLSGETGNYPAALQPEDVNYVGQLMFPDGHYRKLLQAAEQADALVLEMDLQTYRAEFHDELTTLFNTTKQNRRLMRDKSFLRRSRRLAYFSDEYPAEITLIADSTTCPGSSVNESIRCAVVSSTVCVILEPGDDPVEIRKAIVDGLTESFMNGDFVGNIPPDSLRI